MKQLTCEMCGSTGLLKQDGIYVCQSCGTKYSVEEAKKMMIEGTVEIVGTVKIDTSANVVNLLIMAESAQIASNYKEAEDYAKRVLEIDVNNSQAWLVKGKAVGWQSTIANNRFNELLEYFGNAIDNASPESIDSIKESVVVEIVNLFFTMLSLWCENFIKFPDEDIASVVVSDSMDAKRILVRLLAKCGIKPDIYTEVAAEKMGSSVTAVWNDKILPNYQGGNGKPDKRTWLKFTDRCDACITVLKCAVAFLDKDSKLNIKRYNDLVEITQNLVDSCSWKWSYRSEYYYREYSLKTELQQAYNDNIIEYHQKIKEIDSTYVIPERPIPKKIGYCYVATAVYGSYDCPQVWTLRRYRDFILAKTWYGRAFVHIYYAVSPTLVKWFGKMNWFKQLWRIKLDALVERLKEEGVEDSPYNDKPW